MVVRIMKQGYYWPSMHRDAAKVIQEYEKCKEQHAIRKIAKNNTIIAGSLVSKTALLCLTKRTMFHGHHVFSGDANRSDPVNETFHEQTDDELIEKELKQLEADF
ncbi:hypothetical protein Tco_0997907 [Tanacetum coccineum]